LFQHLKVIGLKSIASWYRSNYDHFLDAICAYIAVI